MSKKKLYTTKTLFNTIVDLMKKEGAEFDILDYDLPTRNEINLTNYEFDIIGELTFGANEGIYLVMYVQGFITKAREYERVQLGTFKTLRTDRKSFQRMGILMSDFIWNGRKFINENIDDFDH